jgi:hypothetical protein
MAGLSAADRELAADLRRALVPDDLAPARVPKEHWPPGRRWCGGCRSFVRLEDVARGASRCTTCVSRAQHGSMLERTYTIHGRPFTAEDYATLYAAQDGRCWICDKKSVSRRLAVDHDHRTGEVRGLLDPDDEWGCNYAILGKIRDLAMARRIVTYLETNQAHLIIPR